MAKPENVCDSKKLFSLSEQLWRRPEDFCDPERSEFMKRAASCCDKGLKMSVIRKGWFPWSEQLWLRPDKFLRPRKAGLRGAPNLEFPRHGGAGFPEVSNYAKSLKTCVIQTGWLSWSDQL